MCWQDIPVSAALFISYSGASNCSLDDCYREIHKGELKILSVFYFVFVLVFFKVVVRGNLTLHALYYWPQQQCNATLVNAV